MSLDHAPPRRARAFAASLWRGTVVQRVHDGRLRDLDWPYGLKAVVITGSAVYGLGVLLVIFSATARAASPLVVPATLTASIPSGLVWLLIFMIIFALALFESAALHGPWWLKTLGLLITGLVMGFWGVIGGTAGGLSILRLFVVALVVAAVVFGVVRGRRAYAWWEFPTILGLIGTAVTVGLVGLGGNARRLGFEFAPVLLQQTVTVLGFVAIPAALAAGAAVAEITVAATLVATRQAQRLTHRAWPYAILAVVVGARLVQGGWEVWHFDPVRQGWLAVVPALAVAGLLLGWVLLLMRLARPPARVAISELPGAVGRIGLPVGAALVGVYLPVLVFVLIVQIVASVDPAGAAGQRFLDPVPLIDRATDVVRLLLALLLATLSVRLARRGRQSIALLSGSTAIMLVVLGMRTLTGNRWAVRFDPDLLNLIATVAVLAGIGWYLARRRLTRHRAITFAGMLILSELFSNRDFVSDPIGALLGYSGAALVLFGLTWDFLAGSEWGNGASRRFGRPTRVLLILANTVLTVTMLAYAALVRDPAAATNLDSFAELGDLVLGTALLAAAFVSLLATVSEAPDPVSAPRRPPSGACHPGGVSPL